ncbi:MAG: hypothetical protein P8P24_02375 [Planktomarina sp.]|nr:hypothetical protein [Planktomarina sp.]
MAERDGALDALILKAHARDDRTALVALYTQAADLAGDVDRECFFLTYAHIYALELGHPSQEGLRARLLAFGRE